MSDFVPRTLDAHGRSVDEAIFNGLQSMGVSIDEVTITTIQQGSKGVFGIGAKPCIVRLVERPANYAELNEKQAEKEENAARALAKEAASRPVKAENPQMSGKPAEQRSGEAVKPKAAERSQNKPDAPKTAVQSAAPDRMRAARPQVDRPQSPRGDRPQGDRPQGDRPQGVRSDKRRDDRRRSDGQRGGESRYEDRATPVDSTVYTKYVANQSDCDGARFVSGVLERMGLDAGLGYAQEDDSLKLKIDSDAMGILIGHRGETLDALQYLTGLVVNRGEEGYRRVTLDTENYRNKREETLGRLARKLAGQVRATGKPITLEPMNPYERRVLHFALQSHTYVTTHSEGEEPNRCVVISPKVPGGKDSK